MSRGTILVVDDHPTNLKLCQVMLSVDGYEVHTAADAEEALALLGTVHPGLILMDLQLPGLDGLELTRRLKADPATRDIVIVALTAYAMKGDEQKALDAGCDGYVAKPIDTRLLAATVERYLAQA
jgi:CheY-like chemotaxis protein